VYVCTVVCYAQSHMGIFEVGKGRKPKEKILHRPTAMHGCGNGETNSRRKTGIWKEGRKEGRTEGKTGAGTDAERTDTHHGRGNNTMWCFCFIQCLLIKKLFSFKIPSSFLKSAVKQAAVQSVNPPCHLTSSAEDLNQIRCL
jgi:hypothetical protein